MTSARPADFDPARVADVDRAVLGIDGLWCPSCAAAVTRAISGLPGIRQAQVSYASASAALSWEPGADLRAVARRVAAMGYRLTAPTQGDEMEQRITAEMRRTAVRLAVCVGLGMWTMAFSILLYVDPDGISSGPIGRALSLAAGAAALPVVAWAGAPILLAGWRTARVGAPGMDSLVGLGVIGAIAASVWSLATGGHHVWFDTAVMLVTLLTFGRLVEMNTLRQAGRSIAALRSALPETARPVGPDGQAREVRAETVAAGTRIRVAAGERVPLDGVLLTGPSRFDSAILTGEAAPRRIASGEMVEAGFVNLARVVEIEVTAEIGARRIDRMGLDIATALHDRPEMHRLSDRMARLMVPLALSLAMLSLAGALFAGLGYEEAGLRALSVLVIACPCAVAIAAPLSHLAAVQLAASEKIHFRSPTATEELGAVGRVLFDKTGTLTTGRPVLRAVTLRPGLDRARALALAAAAENEVVHPVARALREAAPHHLLPEASERFDDGVAARVAGHDVLLGSQGFFRARGIAVPEAEDHAEATVAHMALDGVWAARFDLGDALRPDAAETLGQLRAQGLEIGILSGDAAAPCARIGARVGLAASEIRAGCTPEDKAAFVAEGAKPTAFMGDGVNDALAITRADVGIAAGDASPATIALADVVIARGGIPAVARAIAISRRARAVLRQNLVFSVIYNLLGLGLAVFGAVPPLAAAVAMAASSLMVMANSARLRLQAQVPSGGRESSRDLVGPCAT